MVPYVDQFATVYLAVSGDYPFGEDEAMSFLAPMLALAGFSSTQYPSIETITITTKEDEWGDRIVVGGPWDGATVSEDATFITGLKWNLRTKNRSKVTMTTLGPVRDAWRKTRRSLSVSGYRTLTWSLKPYGQPLSGDKGIPSTPALPRVRKPISEDVEPDRRKEASAGSKIPWVPIVVAGVGLIAIANMGED